MDNHIFRSAVGGFNRKDVTEYIEKVQRESGEKLAALESEAEELRRREQEAIAARDAVEDQRKELAEKLDELTRRYEEISAEGEMLRSEAAAGQEKVRQLSQENCALADDVRRMSEELDVLRQEKARVTQLELEARERAQEAMAQAQREGDALVSNARAQAQEMMEKVCCRRDEILAETGNCVAALGDECAVIMEEFTRIAEHITGELRRMDVTAAQLPISLNHLKDGLEKLREKVKQE